jgi:hypothetical protein
MAGTYTWFDESEICKSTCGPELSGIKRFAREKGLVTLAVLANKELHLAVPAT